MTSVLDRNNDKISGVIILTENEAETKYPPFSNIFKWIFLNKNVWILIKIQPEFVPESQNNHILVLVQIMAWLRPGDKPSSELMMVYLLTNICVTRPHWIK